MKKLLSVILTLNLILIPLITFSSCNTESESVNKKSDGISIVTTIFPYYEFARNIAGNKADVKLLLSPGSEPHSYEPSPSDIVAIENCDIFIYNGGESDEWVDSVLSSLQNNDMKIIKMMDYVALLNEQSGEHSHDHEHEHEHKHSEDEESHSHEEENDIEHSHGEGYDEHIWTSVRNAKELSAEIAHTLSELDAENSDYYSENENNYSLQLEKLDEEFTDIVNSSARNTVVFGDRFPFLYFVTDYELEYECAFPGCSSETEPSISTVTHMIDFVKEEEIPTVFYLEFSNGKTAQLIAEDTGADTMLFSSCHNVTKEQFESGVSYISLMEQNATALKEALS